MNETIFIARTATDFQAFAGLLREYQMWFRERYADSVSIVEVAYQSLTLELENLEEKYSPPHGKVLLLKDADLIGGACAYSILPDGTCEMKRFFLTDAFRGRGFGRQLCAAIIEQARADGFQLMRLETGNRYTEAHAIYASFGFQVCKPHLEYPVKLLPYVIFMELPLSTDTEKDL
jgi:GNAT superfamily N-acetyltransferase